MAPVGSFALSNIFRSLFISVNRQTLVAFSKVKGTKLQLKMVVNSTKMSKTEVRSKAGMTCSMKFGGACLV